MTMNDWSTRKMAIDVVYSMAAILKETLGPYKSEILEVLNQLRLDKIKPVREAAIEAITAAKEISADDVQMKSRSVSPSRPSTAATRKGTKSGVR